MSGEAVANGCTIDNIEHAFAKFGPRLKTFLEGVRERVNDTGITGGDIWELDDEFGYELCWPALGVRLFLTDAAEYGDAEEGEEELLVGVMIEAIADGGEIIISFSPYNYTPSVWVDLRMAGAVDELERRIGLIQEGEAETATEILPRLREAAGGWPE